jgi:hypothetical protein
MDKAPPLSSAPYSADPAPAVVTAQARRAWVADFVPISDSDPGLQAALRQLQWALETEKQN